MLSILYFFRCLFLKSFSLIPSRIKYLVKYFWNNPDHKYVFKIIRLKEFCVNMTPISAGTESKPQLPIMKTFFSIAVLLYLTCIFSKNSGSPLTSKWCVFASRHCFTIDSPVNRYFFFVYFSLIINSFLRYRSET